MQKHHVSTVEGQKELFWAASEIAVLSNLNKAIKAKGGTGWDESFITTPNPVLRLAVKEDLLREWNNLVGPKKAQG